MESDIILNQDSFELSSNKGTTNTIFYLNNGLQREYQTTILDLNFIYGNSLIPIIPTITSISIGSTVTIIGQNFFSVGLNWNLATITIPASVREILEEAFVQNQTIKNLIFETESQLIYIGSTCFRECINLTSITLPKSICINPNFDIGYEIFYSIPNPITFTFNGVSSPSEFSLGASKIFSQNPTAPSSTSSYYIYVAPPTVFTFKGVAPLYQETEVTTTEKTLSASLISSKSNLIRVNISNGVTSLANDCFYNCTNLTSVTIDVNNSKIAYIGSRCFASTKIVDFPFPNSVTEIGFGAFGLCTKILEFSFGTNMNLKKIADNCFDTCSIMNYCTLPLSITEIGNGVFNNCVSLKNLNSMNATNQLTKIGTSCFVGCTSLTSFTYSAPINYIGDYCFSGCTGLTSFTLNSQVNYIGDYCFNECSNLITFSGSSNSSLVNLPNYMFQNCINLQNITLPSSIITYGDYCFSGCTKLSTVQNYSSLIPSTITYVGSRCFSGCTSILSLSIPSSITALQNYCFDSCSLISGITLNNNIKIIGEGAILNTKISSITIPSSVTEIGKSVFAFCNNLTYIRFNNVNTLRLCNEIFYGLIGIFSYGQTLTSPIRMYFGGVNLASNVISGTPAYTISQQNPTNPALTSSYYEYDSSAINHNIYYGTTFLTSYTGTVLDTAVLDITNWFIKPTRMDLLYGLTEIKDNFFKTWFLTNITIPASVTKIGNNVFESCTYLTSITFEVGSKLNYLGTNCFKGCNKLKSIEIPSGVTNIGNNCFEGCLLLTGIIINNPLTMTSVGTEIFKLITFPITIGINGHTSFDTILFNGIFRTNFITQNPTNPALNSAYYIFPTMLYYPSVDVLGQISYTETPIYANSLTSTSITSKVNLGYIKLSDSVVSLGNNCFQGCINMTSIIVGSNSRLTSIGESCFEGLTKITEITIGSNVSYLGTNCFKNCSNLNKLIIKNPNSLVSTGTTVFFGKTTPIYFYLVGYTSSNNVINGSGIKSLTLQNPTNPLLTSQYYIYATILKYADGSQVYTTKQELYRTDIANKPFITDIILSDNVTKIGDGTNGTGVFEGCSMLTNFSINSTSKLTSINRNTFKYCTSLTSITFPPSLIYLGSTNFTNCTKLTQINFENPLGLQVIQGANIFEGITNPIAFKLNGIKDVSQMVRSVNGIAVIVQQSPNSYPWKNPDLLTYDSYSFALNKTTIQSSDITDKTKLLSVSIYSSATKISDNCFTDCVKLTSALLNNSSINYLGNNAFKNCTSLSNVLFSSSLTYIGTNCFENCNSLKSINLSVLTKMSTFSNAVFYSCRYLTKVTLPTSITSLNRDLFLACDSLSQINFPNSLTYIGRSTFNGCFGLRNIDLSNTKINRIAFQAFLYCNNLTSIILPSTLQYIESQCFANTGLTNITIPESIMEIQELIFQNCNSLTSIEIRSLNNYDKSKINANQFSTPKTITFIFWSYSSLQECKSSDIGSAYITSLQANNPPINGVRPALTSSYYKFYNTRLTRVDGTFTNFNGRELTQSIIGTPNTLRSVTIGGYLTSIANNCFLNCSQLISINIPDNIRNIGSGAFKGCLNISSFSLPTTITIISENCFENCSLLTSIMFFNISSLGNYSFSGCTKLSSFTLPETVTQIGNNCFSNCINLRNFTVKNSLALVSTGTNLFSGITDSIVFRFEKVADFNEFDTLNSAVKNLAMQNPNMSDLTNTTYFKFIVNVFTYNNGLPILRTGEQQLTRVPNKEVLQTAKINDTCTSIANNLFQDSSVVDLILPNTITNIGSIAPFKNCKFLKNIILPIGLTQLPESTFQSNTSLYQIKIPPNIKFIGSYCFFNCWSLNTIIFDNVLNITNVGNNILTRGTNQLNVNKSRIFVFNGLTSPNQIPIDHPIRYVINENIVIDLLVSDYYKFIGPNTIISNSNNSKTFNNSYTTLNQDMVANFFVTNITIGAYVDTLDDELFKNKSITTIFIPYNVTKIGNNLFDNCSSLTRITIANPFALTSIGSDVFANFSNQRNQNLEIKFEDLSNVSELVNSYVLSNIYTQIDAINSASNAYKIKIIFNGPTKLFTNGDSNNILAKQIIDTELTKETIKVGYAGGLSNIIIAYNVTSLEQQLFSVFNIETIYIPNSITSLPYRCFYGCIKLKEVLIEGFVMNFGEECFSGCTNLTTVKFVRNRSNLDYSYFGDTDNSLPHLSIGQACFKNCSSLTEVEFLGNDLNNIPQECFYGCNNIKKVSMPNCRIVKIYDNAFADCFNMTECPTLEYIQNISLSAFSNCSSLISVKLSKDIGFFNSQWFKSCINLKNIDLTNAQVCTTNRNDIINNNYTNSILKDYNVITCQLPINPDFNEIISNFFENCGNLLEINIPNYVIKILNSSFKNCRSLKTINISNKIKIIGNECFANCSNLTSVIFDASDTKLITSIGNLAFFNCSSLLTINIPYSVSSLGSGCFTGCSDLIYVKFENYDMSGNMINKINELNAETFINCKKLKYIDLPINLQKIKYNCFKNCSSLVKINLPDSLQIIENNAFNGCTQLSSITIPNSVKVIENNFLAGCTGIKNIVVGNGIVTLPEYAFAGITSLTNVSFTLPCALTEFSNYMFKGCIGLTEITIPPSITRLGIKCFEGCAGLTKLTIPKNITIIDESICLGCTFLQDITIEDATFDIKNYFFAGYEIRDSYNILRNDSSGIPAKFNSNGQDSRDFHVPIKLSIRNYMYNSLASNGMLTYVNKDPIKMAILDEINLLTRNSTINFINDNLNVTKMTYIHYTSNSIIRYPMLLNDNIIIQNNDYKTVNTTIYRNYVTKYYSYATNNLNNYILENNRFLLKFVRFSNNVVEISNSAFQDSSIVAALFDINNSLLQKIGDNAFKGSNSLDCFTIPNNVLSIGISAFENCNNLYRINNIENTTIGIIPENCFKGSGLGEIIIPNSITYLGRESFSNTNKLSLITFSPNISRIEDYAFNNSFGLKSITIKSNFTYIGASCFTGCKNLISITIETTESSAAIGEYAFNGCSSLINIEIKGNITSFGNYCFSNLSSLETIIMPNIQSIPIGAFQGCSKLKNIVIPNSVTKINNYAFYNCSSLTLVEIPDNVREIGNNIFPGCTNLTYVKLGSTINAQLAYIGEQTFDGCSKLYNIDIYNVNKLQYVGYNAFYNTPPKTVQYFSIQREIDIYSTGGAQWLNRLSVTQYTRIYNVTDTNFTYFYYNKGTSSSFSVIDNEINLNVYNPVGRSISDLNLVTFKNMNVTSLGYGCFMNAKSLQEILLKTDLGISTIKNISPYCFYGCSSLKDVYLPTTVTFIGESCFNGCSSLINIDYNNLTNITTISKKCFYGCKSLTYFNIPSRITYVDNEAFAYSGIVNVTHNSSCSFGNEVFAYSNYDPSIQMQTKNSILFDNESTKSIIPALESFRQIMTISDGQYKESRISGNYNLTNVTSYGTDCFKNCRQLGGLILSSNITVIPRSFCEGCSNLSILIIPSNVTKIENNAFKDCTNLQNILLPNNLGHIGDNCFKSCRNVDALILPNNITYLGESAFEDCTTLNKVSYGGMLLNETYIYGCLLMFKNIKIVTSYIKYFTSLLQNPFSQFINLLNIKREQYDESIAKLVSDSTHFTRIKNNNDASGFSFSTLNQLSTRNIYNTTDQSTVEGVVKNKFTDFINNFNILLQEFKDRFISLYNNSNILYVSPNFSVEQLDVTDEINNIYFDTKIIEKNIESYNAYRVRNRISEINTSQSNVLNTNIRNNLNKVTELFNFLSGTITDFKSSTFKNCNNLQSITIPYSLTYIGTNCFFNTSIKTVIFPINITTISADAFSNNDNYYQIETVNFMDLNKVVTISPTAFMPTTSSQCLNVIIQQYSSVTDISGTPRQQIVAANNNKPISDFNYYRFKGKSDEIYNNASNAINLLDDIISKIPILDASGTVLSSLKTSYNTYVLQYTNLLNSKRNFLLNRYNSLKTKINTTKKLYNALFISIGLMADITVLFNKYMQEYNNKATNVTYLLNDLETHKGLLRESLYNFLQLSGASDDFRNGLVYLFTPSTEQTPRKLAYGLFQLFSIVGSVALMFVVPMGTVFGLILSLINIIIGAAYKQDLDQAKNLLYIRLDTFTDKLAPFRRKLEELFSYVDTNIHNFKTKLEDLGVYKDAYLYETFKFPDIYINELFELTEIHNDYKTLLHLGGFYQVSKHILNNTNTITNHNNLIELYKSYSTDMLTYSNLFKEEFLFYNYLYTLNRYNGMTTLANYSEKYEMILSRVNDITTNETVDKLTEYVQTGIQDATYFTVGMSTVNRRYEDAKLGLLLDSVFSVFDIYEAISFVRAAGKVAKAAADIGETSLTASQLLWRAGGNARTIFFKTIRRALWKNNGDFDKLLPKVTDTLGAFAGDTAYILTAIPDTALSGLSSGLSSVLTSISRIGSKNKSSTVTVTVYTVSDIVDSGLSVLYNAPGDIWNFSNKLLKTERYMKKLEDAELLAKKLAAFNAPEEAGVIARRNGRRSGFRVSLDSTGDNLNFVSNLTNKIEIANSSSLDDGIKALDKFSQKINASSARRNSTIVNKAASSIAENKQVQNNILNSIKVAEKDIEDLTKKLKDILPNDNVGEALIKRVNDTKKQIEDLQKQILDIEKAKKTDPDLKQLYDAYFNAFANKNYTEVDNIVIRIDNINKSYDDKIASLTNQSKNLTSKIDDFTKNSFQINKLEKEISDVKTTIKNFENNVTLNGHLKELDSKIKLWNSMKYETFPDLALRAKLEGRIRILQDNLVLGDRFYENFCDHSYLWSDALNAVGSLPGGNLSEGNQLIQDTLLAYIAAKTVPDKSLELNALYRTQYSTNSSIITKELSAEIHELKSAVKTREFDKLHLVKTYADEDPSYLFNTLKKISNESDAELWGSYFGSSKILGASDNAWDFGKNFKLTASINKYRFNRAQKYLSQIFEIGETKFSRGDNLFRSNPTEEEQIIILKKTNADLDEYYQSLYKINHMLRDPNVFKLYRYIHTIKIHNIWVKPTVSKKIRDNGPDVLTLNSKFMVQNLKKANKQVNELRQKISNFTSNISKISQNKDLFDMNIESATINLFRTDTTNKNYIINYASWLETQLTSIKQNEIDTNILLYKSFNSTCNFIRDEIFSNINNINAMQSNIIDKRIYEVDKYIMNENMIYNKFINIINNIQNPSSIAELNELNKADNQYESVSKIFIPCIDYLYGDIDANPRNYLDDSITGYFDIFKRVIHYHMLHQKYQFIGYGNDYIEKYINYINNEQQNFSNNVYSNIQSASSILDQMINELNDESNIDFSTI